jgi:hypothetical protein
LHFAAFTLATLAAATIDIKFLQNRLLKVCYVPATSAAYSKAFFAAAINSTNKINKAGSPSFLDVYGCC